MIIEINNSNACAGMPKSSSERAIYAFDAKYRREDYNGTWIPLREDIDKMHAYRDAIGQVIDTDFQRILKSAVVLFPAQVDSAYQTHAFIPVCLMESVASRSCRGMQIRYLS